MQLGTAAIQVLDVALYISDADCPDMEGACSHHYACCRSACHQGSNPNSYAQPVAADVIILSDDYACSGGTARSVGHCR